MDDMISLARSNDHDGLCRLANAVRRRHHIRIRNLLNKLLVRHPRTLKKIMKNHKNTEKLGQRDIVSLNTGLLKVFSESDQKQNAIDIIDALSASDICPVRTKILGRYKQELLKAIKCRTGIYPDAS